MESSEAGFARVDYGGVIKGAFGIALRNRYLWFFGFFVAGGSVWNFGFPSIPGGGGPGGPGGPQDSPGGLPDGPSVGFGGALDGPPALAASVSAVPFPTDGPPWLDGGTLLYVLAAAGVAVLLLGLAFVVLSVISDGALAEGVAALRRGEERRFGTTWRAGTSRFWRVLGLKIVLLLLGVALALAVGLPAALAGFAVFGLTESVAARVVALGLGALLAVLLLVAGFVVLSILGQLSLRALAVDGSRVFASVGDGARLLWRNPGRTLLVWLISVGLAIGIAVAALLVFVLAGGLLFLPSIALYSFGYEVAAVASGAASGLLLLVLVVVATGAVGSFAHAYWTLAYLQLSGGDPAEGPDAGVMPDTPA